MHAGVLGLGKITPVGGFRDTQTGPLGVQKAPIDIGLNVNPDMHNNNYVIAIADMVSIRNGHIDESYMTYSIGLAPLHHRSLISTTKIP